MENETARRVLAFDIGIKNLAWCCIEKTGGAYKILGWDNYNLLEEESAGAVGEKCSQPSCKANAIYTCGTMTDADSGESVPNCRCGRHIPTGFSLFKDEKDKPMKKLPSVSTLKKVWKETYGVSVSAGSASAKKVTGPSGKDALIAAIAHCYAIPIVSKKVVRNVDASLSALHDSIGRLVKEKKDLWSTAHVICLENQPAFKNPTMKSVQILLFATIRDYYGVLTGGVCAPLKLVHAKKKVEGVEKGDKGYKARKEGGEARAVQFLHGPGLVGGAPWIKLWMDAKKKSDLADGLCMCLDQLA